MRVTLAQVDAMLGAVRLVNASESNALLGPPRPQLMATAAGIQSVLLESGLLPRELSLDPIFRWPPGVDHAACRG